MHGARVASAIPDKRCLHRRIYHCRRVLDGDGNEGPRQDEQVFWIGVIPHQARTAGLELSDADRQFRKTLSRCEVCLATRLPTGVAARSRALLRSAYEGYHQSAGRKS